MLKKPFSFEGRIRRTEYGISYIMFIIFSLLAGMLIGKFTSNKETNSLLFLLIAIPAYWFLIAQGSKRCHDRGNTGWFQLIPFYGFWMLFADSENGANQYGQNPKGIGNTDEIDQIGDYLPK